MVNLFQKNIVVLTMFSEYSTFSEVEKKNTNANYICTYKHIMILFNTKWRFELTHTRASVACKISKITFLGTPMGRWCEFSFWIHVVHNRARVKAVCKLMCFVGNYRRSSCLPTPRCEVATTVRRLATFRRICLQICHTIRSPLCNVFNVLITVNILWHAVINVVPFDIQDVSLSHVKR